MNILTPEDAIAGVDAADNVPVARERCFGGFVSAQRTQRVTHVRVAQLLKRSRRNALIARADEHRHVQQLIRKRLKVPIQPGGAQCHELPCAAFVGADLHRVMAVMFVGERMEGQTDLFELARALGLTRAEFAFGNGRQKQRRKNGDDRNHHEQLDQRESTPPETMPNCIHGASLALSDQHIRCRVSFTPLSAKQQLFPARNPR